jgi:hypothetical protein
MVPKVHNVEKRRLTSINRRVNPIYSGGKNFGNRINKFNAPIAKPKYIKIEE